MPTASWSGSESPYTQAVTITGGDSNTKIDLLPDSTILGIMETSKCTALYVSNLNGVFTAYAIKNIPTSDITVSAAQSKVVTS